MKFLKYIFLVGVIASCDVTDLGPLDSISETLAFTTPEKIELSMNGVYDAAQSGFYRGAEGNNRGYIFGAAHVQQNEMRGEDMLLINTFYGFTYQATWTTTTENNSYYWENGWRLVNLCNLFIEGVTTASGGVITEAEADAYIAEARFLRAMAYHELVIMFARPYSDAPASPGLPLIESGTNSSASLAINAAIGRSTVAETYDFILDDLDYAETNAPEDNGVTRATSGAAIALKTRVYLHMEDYTNVIAEGNKLVPAGAPFSSAIGGYALTADVEGPWADNESSDNIFSMAMGVNDNLNVNAALCNMLATSDHGARGEVAISPLLWNQTWWDVDDLRRTMSTTASAGGDGQDGMVAVGASGRLFTNKYRDYTNNTDYAPIIRYAEVLLNVAEAEANNSGDARAEALVNAVRDRAISGGMTSYSGLTNTALRTAIAQERRIELAFEGFRWKDLHRAQADIPAKMISAEVTGGDYSIGNTSGLLTSVTSIPYSDFRYLWPLPASEINSNPVLAQEQNPGY